MCANKLAAVSLFNYHVHVAFFLEQIHPQYIFRKFESRIHSPPTSRTHHHIRTQQTNIKFRKQRAISTQTPISPAPRKVRESRAAIRFFPLQVPPVFPPRTRACAIPRENSHELSSENPRLLRVLNIQTSTIITSLQSRIPAQKTEPHRSAQKTARSSSHLSLYTLSLYL